MKNRILIVSSTIALTIFFMGTYPRTLFSGTSLSSHKDGESPLINEMITLDSVFRKVVSAVSLGDGGKVSRVLEDMHGTKEKTHEGIHTGKVKIPKNSHRITEFVKLDQDFHEDLEDLAAAGKNNDRARMLTVTKKLLDQCVYCHGIFRD